MYDSAHLQVVRDTPNDDGGNTVFLDWWAAGTRNIDNEYQRVIDLSLSESESLELDQVEHRLFTELVIVLNQLHRTNYPLRFWRIFVGAWHQEFFFTLVDRYKRLLKSSEYSRELSFSVSSVSAKKRKVLQDATHFPGLTGNIAWESNFVEEIVKILKDNDKLQHIKIVESQVDYSKLSGVTPDDVYLSWAAKLLRFLDPISFFLESKSGIEVADTYLSKAQEISLRRRIGNPSFFRLGQKAVAGMSDVIDVASRKVLANGLNNAAVDTLSLLWAKTVAFHIPLTSIEGFPSLAEICKLKCDRYVPKVFFTSNRFGMSDTERFMIAEKVLRGSRYCVAQHGNNYGVTFRPKCLPEEETSDVFYRWSKPAAPNSNSLGVITADLRLPHKPRKINSNLCNILIVGSQPPARTFRYYDWDQYFDSEHQSMQLVNDLTAMGHTVKYRPYKGNIFGGGPTIEFVNWLESPQVSKSVGIFRDAIAESHLTIFMYDSTGFLELVSRDFPTLQIQSGATRHVSHEYTDLYSKMIDVGLLHEKVETVVDELDCLNIDEWWNTQSRHSVRNEIKERLAFDSPSIVKDLSQKLLASLES